MVARLIDEVGFGWTMRICAFLILFLLLIANFVIKSNRPPPPPKAPMKDKLVQPFKELPFLGVMAGVFFFNFGYFVPITYLVVQGIDAGMRPNLAQYLVPILNAAR